MNGKRNIAKKMIEHNIPDANSEMLSAFASHWGRFIKSMLASSHKTGDMGKTRIRIRKNRGVRSFPFNLRGLLTYVPFSFVTEYQIMPMKPRTIAA